MRQNFRLLALACVALVAACDGVGTAVVARLPQPRPVPPECLVIVPTCGMPLPALAPIDPPLQTRPESCAPICELRPDGEGTCALVKASEEGLVTLTRERCLSLTIDLREQRGVVRLEASALSVADLTVLADEPVELVVSAALIEDTTFALVGPVSLRTDQALTLRRTRIESGSADASVRLERVSAEHVSLGREGQPFAGEVQLYAASLWHSTLRARRVEIESSELRDVQLEADSLSAVDVALERLTLNVGVGSIASGRAEALHVLACGALLLAGMPCADCVLRGCDEQPLRLDDMRLLRGYVLGEVSLVGGSAGRTMFGQGAPSWLKLYGTSFENNVLCEGTAGFSYQDTTPGCTQCRGAALSDPRTSCAADALVLDEATLGVALPAGGKPISLLNPDCPELDVLPPCEDFPPPDRPFD